MLALHFKRHSLSRLLLSLPGLDTSIRKEVNNTALQKACYNKAPLDIVTTLARLSTLETINMKNNYGDTALMTSLSGFNSTCLVVATRNSISRMLLSVQTQVIRIAVQLYTNGLQVLRPAGHSGHPGQTFQPRDSQHEC